jgi:anti-sigma factor RsiW
MMTLLRGLGPPGESEMFAGNHRHATWDAAYLLGALCAADRREFEGHMADCPSCRYAVAELSGTPALLSQLDRNCVAAISEADHTSGAPEMSPELLPSSLATVRWRRRRTRLITWMAAAAAAIVLTIGVLVGVAGRSPTSPPPQATVSAQQMAQVGTSLLASTVSLSSRQWGTYTALMLCMAPVYAHHDTLAMVVSGSRRQPNPAGDLGGDPGPFSNAYRQHFDAGQPDRRGAGRFGRQRPGDDGALAVNSVWA